MVTFHSPVFSAGSRYDRLPGLLLPGKHAPSLSGAFSSIIVCSFHSLVSLSALLHRGDLRIRKHHGRHSGQRRDLSNHRRACPECRIGAKHFESHALMRHVRLLWSDGISCEWKKEGGAPSLWHRINAEIKSVFFLWNKSQIYHPPGGFAGQIWGVRCDTVGDPKRHGRDVLVSSPGPSWKQRPWNSLLSGGRFYMCVELWHQIISGAYLFCFQRMLQCCCLVFFKLPLDGANSFKSHTKWL